MTERYPGRHVLDVCQNPELVPAEQALPGRDTDPGAPAPHAVLGTLIWARGARAAFPIVGIGCFWGVEKMYWELDGVEGTSVGYAGGVSPHPTHREVCSGAPTTPRWWRWSDPEKIS